MQTLKTLESYLPDCNFLGDVIHGNTTYLTEVEKLKDWYLPSIKKKINRVFGEAVPNLYENTNHLGQLVDDFEILSKEVDFKSIEMGIHKETGILRPKDYVTARFGLTGCAVFAVLPAVLPYSGMGLFFSGLSAGGLFFAAASIFPGTDQRNYKILKHAAKKTDGLINRLKRIDSN